jgi:putative peptide zinc metalloprotease protein
VLVTVPLLLFSLAMMVISLPRLLGTAWASVLKQQSLLSESLAAGDIAGAAVRALAIAAVALPVVGIFYVLLRLVRQLTTGLWQKTRGKAVQRGAAIAVVGALAAGLAWAWWPGEDTYRPVQPYERGTLADVTTAVFPTASSATLREGQAGKTVALWPAGSAKPTREQPQLSMVLIPRADSATSPAKVDGGTAAPPSWVFPFDQPAAPEEGDNQALAVNTQDGSVRYDVAFALVWAEDGEPVDTTNEAYAFASCTDCAAVAVGFQVVLIVGQADVIVPENLSAAANYNCVRCLTYALASQLVLTLDGPLSEEGMARLNALWAEIAEFGRNVQNVPLSEIQERLNAFKAQVTEIVQSDPSATRNTGTATPSSPASLAPSPGSTSGTTSGSSPAPSSGVTRTTPAPSGTTTAPAAPAPAPPAPAPPAPAETGGTAPDVATATPQPTEPPPAPTATGN